MGIGSGFLAVPEQPSPSSPPSPQTPQNWEEEDCCICLEKVSKAVLTPCSHLFCYPCIAPLVDLTSPLATEPPNRFAPFTKEIACPLCRMAIPPNQLRALKPNKAPESLYPTIQTIFGQEYLQLGKSGEASYCFEKNGECYISYKHAPPHWKLSDGSSPPEKKHFLNPQFDQQERIFRGTIDWSPLTFGDSQVWKYEMKFSEDFSLISSGSVAMEDSHGVSSSVSYFNSGNFHGLHYWVQKLSVFQEE